MQVTIAPAAGRDGTIRYSVSIIGDSSSQLTSHGLYQTLEAALDSFDPPLKTRVRSHVVEAVRGEGKPVDFCLEDSVEKQ